MEDGDNGGSFSYTERQLFRKWRPQGSEKDGARECDQLVLSTKCRDYVQQLSHEVPMAGVTKTKDRVLRRYYWPGIFKDVANSCRSCEVCQWSTSKKPRRVEMMPMPLLEHPF